MSTNDTGTSGSPKGGKKLQSRKVNDDIEKKGATISGGKPNPININPVSEQAEHTAVTNLNMRAQPVHKGHVKVIKAVEDEAKRVGGSAHIVTSHSEGDAKNPISASKKVGYLKKVAAPGTHVSSTSREAPSIFHTAARLNRHAHHLVVVAGSDRAKEYETLLNKYNGKEGPHGFYNFKSITVKAIGRDPDAEGTEGISGTKMREHAKKGNIKGFKSGLPPELHQHAEEMMNDINKADKKKMKTVDEEFGETFIDTDDTLSVLEAIDAAHREAVARSGDRKKIQFVARKDQDRKESPVPYRQASIQKNVDEAKKPKSGWDRIWNPKTISGRKMIAASDEAQKAAEALRAAAKQKTNEAFDQLDEISKELVGQVNKKRTLMNIPSKTKKASDVLKRAVDRAAGVRTQKNEEAIQEKRGLWDNIHAKRKRIKAGSGERMRRPGEKGRPTAQDFKDASK